MGLSLDSRKSGRWGQKGAAAVGGGGMEPCLGSGYENRIIGVWESTWEELLGWRSVEGKGELSVELAPS